MSIVTPAGTGAPLASTATGADSSSPASFTGPTSFGAIVRSAPSASLGGLASTEPTPELPHALQATASASAG